MTVPILTTTAEVATLANELAGQAIIAVDLEADSMHRYRERVCLMQLSTPGSTVLIDPLAGAELTPLAKIFADPAVRKIFHAADYDLRSLYRDFRFDVITSYSIHYTKLYEVRIGTVIKSFQADS